MSGAAAQVVGNGGGSRLSSGSYAPGWVVGGGGNPFGDPR
jgi:hypothetical protein